MLCQLIQFEAYLFSLKLFTISRIKMIQRNAKHFICLKNNDATLPVYENSTVCCSTNEIDVFVREPPEVDPTLDRFFKISINKTNLMTDSRMRQFVMFFFRFSYQLNFFVNLLFITAVTVIIFRHDDSAFLRFWFNRN